MPVVKRRKNAQEEEDETYEHQISGSDPEESDQEEEVQEEEDSEVQYETDGASNDEEELPTTSKSLREQAMELKKKGVAKRKTAPEKKVVPVKKMRVVITEKPTPVLEKKVKKPVKNVVQKGSKDRVVVEESKKAPGTIEYNDKNVDFNLYNEAPEHIKNVKIKISSNVVMLCRMIEATGNTSQGLTYDYAAISFVRQSKNGKAYEFNLPLNLAPSIQKGISLLIKSNPKFFESKVTLVQHDEEME